MAFKKSSVDAAEKANDKIKSNKTWSPPAGEDGDWRETRVRFLPQGENSTQDDDNYFYWAPVHSGLPGARFGVICPRMQHGLPCAACDLAQELFSAGKRDKASPWWPKFKAAVNLVPLKKNGKLQTDEDGEPIVKIQTWIAPKTLWEDLQAKIKKLPKADRDVTNIVTGVDSYINRKGTKMEDTKYEIRLNLDPSGGAIHTALQDEVIALVEADDSVLRDLTTIFQEVSSEKVEQLMTAPAPKALAAGKSSSAYADDDDEEDEDDDVIEGEVRVIPEPDGPDEDDDDEDEEPAPPVRKAKAPAVDKKAKESEAQQKLLAKLKGKAEPTHAFDTDDDDDDEDD